MTQQEQIAKSIPHSYRDKILFQWLPNATPHKSDASMMNLLNAYYIFVDPAGRRNDDCPTCINNVLTNWKQLAGAMAEAEKEYNTIHAL